MTRRPALLLFCISTFFFLLWSCTSPETELARAKSSRDDAAFARFLQKHPTGELADLAQNYRRDIATWQGAEAQGSLDSYQQYQARFPHGLFSAEAAQRVDELSTLEYATAADTQPALDDYLQKWPQGKFRSAAQRRRVELEPAAHHYATFNDSTSVDELKTAVAQAPATGYRRLLQQRLENAALHQTAQRILSRKEYQALGNFEEVVAVIEQADDPQARLLARQVAEEVLMAAIDLAGPGTRFVLTSVEIRPEHSPDRHTVRVEGDKEIHFTELPDDTILLTMILGPYTMRSSTTGEIALPTSGQFSVGYGGVIRFMGRIQIRPGYVIEGSENDPLSFYVVKDVGLVYLRGKGTMKEEGQGTRRFPPDTRTSGAEVVAAPD